MDSLRDLDFDVQYREGVVNGNADGMSRQAWLDNDDESLEGEVLCSPEDNYINFVPNYCNYTLLLPRMRSCPWNI